MVHPTGPLGADVWGQICSPSTLIVLTEFPSN